MTTSTNATQVSSPMELERKAFNEWFRAKVFGGRTAEEIAFAMHIEHLEVIKERDLLRTNKGEAKRLLNEKSLRDFEQYIRDVAKQKRDTAGFNGEWSDGGADRLEGLIDAYIAGVEGRIPEGLNTYYTAFLKANDPDVKALAELQKKIDEKYGNL